MPTIENWVGKLKPHCRLVGNIKDHANPDVGKEGCVSITSPIVKVSKDKSMVTTESGTVYVLGEMMSDGSY